MELMLLTTLANFPAHKTNGEQSSQTRSHWSKHVVKHCSCVMPWWVMPKDLPRMSQWRKPLVKIRVLNLCSNILCPWLHPLSPNYLIGSATDRCLSHTALYLQYRDKYVTTEPLPCHEHWLQAWGPHPLRQQYKTYCWPNRVAHLASHACVQTEQVWYVASAGAGNSRHPGFLPTHLPFHSDKFGCMYCHILVWSGPSTLTHQCFDFRAEQNESLIFSTAKGVYTLPCSVDYFHFHPAGFSKEHRIVFYTVWFQCRNHWQTGGPVTHCRKHMLMHHNSWWNVAVIRLSMLLGVQFQLKDLNLKSIRSKQVTERLCTSPP